MDKLLEGIKVTFADFTVVNRWVPHAELIASRERVITLERELDGIVEKLTDPERRVLELESELARRDEWIDKLVAVTTAATMLVERVPVPIRLADYRRQESQLNEPVRYRLQIRQTQSGVIPLQPLWDALEELDRFGKAAK